MPSSSFDQDLGFTQIIEQFDVEKFISQLPIERTMERDLKFALAEFGVLDIVPEVHAVGDCVFPGDTHAAISQAYANAQVL